MKKLVFGIDIGGTNTAFGLVDEKGEIFGESAISTRSYMAYDDYPRYIEDLAAAMKTLLGGISFNYDLVGIGIGAPNGNYYKGAGEYAFFVKEGEKIVRRKVQLGNSNYDYVEVVAGLDEGCQVVLNDMENYNSRKEIKLK